MALNNYYKVVKDIDREEPSRLRLLIEEQLVGDILYTISDSYAPSIENYTTRVSLSKVNENDFRNYYTTHGLDLSDDIVRSYYMVDDKNKSTHESYWMDKKEEYFDEVISAFDELINSGNSKFSKKAEKVFEKVKTYTKEVMKK